MALRLSRMNLSPPEDASAVEWESVNCLLCDRPGWVTAFEVQDASPDGSGLWFPVARCQSCGFHFTNPRPTEASLLRFYPTAYPPHRPHDRGRRVKHSRRYARLPKWLRAFPRPGRVLDFGCGAGLFLDRMRQAGWQGTGIDTSVEMVRYVREVLNIPAHCGTLPHLALPPRSFDLVTMWHSLEHAPRPRQTLQAAWDLLAPGGKLIVAVPNMGCLAARWFPQTWFGWDLPRHCSHFTPRTLCDMLTRCSFAPGRAVMVRHNKWLRQSAALAQQQGNRSLACRLLRNRAVSSWVNGYAALTRRSDCIMVMASKM